MPAKTEPRLNTTSAQPFEHGPFIHAAPAPSVTQTVSVQPLPAAQPQRREAGEQRCGQHRERRRRAGQHLYGATSSNAPRPRIMSRPSFRRTPRRSPPAAARRPRCRSRCRARAKRSDRFAATTRPTTHRVGRRRSQRPAHLHHRRSTAWLDHDLVRGDRRALHLNRNKCRVCRHRTRCANRPRDRIRPLGAFCRYHPASQQIGVQTMVERHRGKTKFQCRLTRAARYAGAKIS